MNYNKAEFYTSFGKFSQIPKSDRLEFVFSGRSNVGKSSLINKLLNRKNLARVSSMPGKTVTINFFSVENIYIVDLPGYGYASVSKSEKRQWGSLVFQLVDMRHPPSKDDLMMINYLIDAEIPFIIVFTKADKLKPNARKARMEAFKTEIPCFEDITCVEFSAITGEGVDELRAIIDDISEGAEITPPEKLESDTEDEEEEYYDDKEDISDEPKSFGGFLTPNRRKN